MLIRSINNMSVQSKSTIATSAVITVGSVFLALAIGVYWMAYEDLRLWHQYRDQASVKERAVGALTQELGYGATIHQFKNYVLRKDEKRIRKIDTSIGGALFALREYERRELSREEASAIEEIRAVVEAYGHQLRTAQAMAEKGLDARAIDQAVKIDDGPALKGLETLKAAVREVRLSGEQTTHQQLLNALRASLGYGGMIHQFKNYVLRQDAGRVAKVQQAAEAAREAISAYRNLGASPLEEQGLDTIDNVISAYLKALDRAQTLASNGKSPEAVDQAIKIDDGPALAALNELDVSIASRTSDLEDMIERDFKRIETTALIIILAAITSSAVLGLFIRQILKNAIARPLLAMTEAVGKVRAGHKAEMPDLDRQDEIGELARSFQEAADQSVDALRTKLALDNADVSVMVADANHDIVYVNNQLLEMFGAAESDIRRDLPNFRSDHLIGVNIDSFHKNAAHQRGMLAKLTGTHKAEIKVGGRDFTFVANPVLSVQGERLGTVVEWRDLTMELAVREATEQVVTAANAGDFSKRIDTGRMQGTMGGLADGINQLTQVIDESTRSLGSMLEALARGDLTRRIDADYQGTLGELKDNANRTAEQLAAVVGQIQAATGEVHEAASEITSGTEDLSRRTEQAASSLQETAASAEEMSATVRQNAENAKNASELAESANSSARTGGEVVEQAVGAMAGIEDSAKKITDIISVIDEIAFQTNLLALNASVEAARAGEAGKGFAVVAQEVRQLAQRAAQAAQDIKQLIQDSNTQIKDGVQLVNRAGEALGQIVGSIGKVAEIVEEISGASQDQAAGVQEINSSIASMDDMTQQNSALVEENTATTRALSDQAKGLAELTAYFKLEINQTLRPSRSLPSTERRPTISDTLASADSDEGWNEF